MILFRGRKIAKAIETLTAPTASRDARYEAVVELGEIGEGNQEAMTTLLRIWESTYDDDRLRTVAADSLEFMSGDDESTRGKIIESALRVLQAIEKPLALRIEATDLLDSFAHENPRAITALRRGIESEFEPLKLRIEMAKTLYDLVDEESADGRFAEEFRQRHDPDYRKE